MDRRQALLAMSMILSILGSSAFGTALGSFFQWLNRKEERASLAEKNRHDEAMQTLANSQAIALADKGIEAAKEAGKTAVEQEEAKGFTESQKPSVISAFSEALKSWVRAIIVAYLLALCTYLAVEINSLVGGLSSIPVDQLTEMYREIIAQSFTLLSFAVGWYYAARGTSISKRIRK